MGCVKLHILDEQYKSAELKVSYINKKLTSNFCIENVRSYHLYLFSGNILTNIAGVAAGAYVYDANGNMTHDGRRGFDVEYNLIDLVYRVKENGTVKVTYKYLADGTKLGVIDNNNKGFDYLGSFVYANNNNTRTFESTSFGGGRINKTNGNYEITYFITDHLGSTRVVVSSAGAIVGTNDYYPFGKRWEGMSVQLPTTRYLFSGKEWQTTGSVNYMDFGSRMYDDFLGRWFTHDPQSYKRPWDSPYAYCGGNPVCYFDPNGELPWFIPVIIGAVVGAYTGASLQSGTAAFWNWKSDAWKGAISGAIIGGTIGYGVAGVIGASGMTTTVTTAAGTTVNVTTKAAGIVSTMLNSGTINIAMSGGGWDGAWKAGIAGLVTGGWNATGGFGMVNRFASLGGKLGYQMIGTVGASVGNNWARGEKLFSKVTLGVGPVNLTLGKGQKLLQWQNNIGNIATNAFGLVNLAFGGKVDPDWKNLSFYYTGGIIDKLYDPLNGYSGFGAHAIIGNSNLENVYSHELHHLWQSRAFGDMFLLNYGLQGIGAMLMKGGSFLKEYNYFEDVAYGEYWW